MNSNSNSSDDLLSRATRALRDTTPPDVEVGPPEGVAATTLARISRSTRVQRAKTIRRRTYTRWIVMPMAASFIVFCAWASASGRLSQWVSSRSSHDDDERTLHAPPEATPTAAKLPAIAPSIAPSIEPSLPTPEPSASVEAPSKAVPKVVGPDLDALYHDAHEAHFVRRDPAAALAAWDRYLAAAGPSGRFTLEARYNRAISLVRLGRKSEAAAALRPFANGDYGGYRRDEATDLLRTLE